jgi:5-formaminoimidazole-4-carboxamide-1-beta-D-ribofuranosyl 5'-monophosphate synthetase
LYQKSGISLASTKKGALTEYFKTIYINLIKNKNSYYFNRYAKIYGERIVKKLTLNMDEREIQNMLFHHRHIVVPSQDFEEINLTESEIKNLAKAVKTPKKGLNLSESARTEVVNAFKQFREDVKANRTATKKPTATKKAVNKRVIAKKK